MEAVVGEERVDRTSQGDMEGAWERTMVEGGFSRQIKRTL